MYRPLLIAILMIGLSGCSAKKEVGRDSPLRPLETKIIDEAGNDLSRDLAYERSITIDSSENKIVGLFESIQKFCHDASADACIVLNSNIEMGRNPSALIKFRAKPKGIQKLVDSIGKQGEIVEQSTHAEELATPLMDASKQLEMLKDYRSKIETLLNRKNLDADSLIKLNKELSQAQSEIETQAGKQAFLNQRLETEILSVSIVTYKNLSFWNPITRSVHEFGTNLSQGISSAIIGIAFLIPWLILLLFLVWLGRKVWRRRNLTKSELTGRQGET